MIRFIFDFPSLVRSITLMLKKDQVFKWTLKTKIDFEKIKEVISSALVLTNLDFSKDFVMYVYGNEDNITTILTQKDEGS